MIIANFHTKVFCDMCTPPQSDFSSTVQLLQEKKQENNTVYCVFHSYTAELNLFLSSQSTKN